MNMNKTLPFDPWHDRHTINMEPEQVDRFSDEDSLFAGQPNEKQYAIADALDSLPNERYRRLLVGQYYTPQLMAEEMEVSLPNFYNLYHRALASLKAHMG
jgi:DNA-directed RNA polymerase specialized sigma24 family protein